MSDAGVCYREYTCPACGLVWHPPTTQADDDRASEHFERWGTAPDAQRMCPRCNTPEAFKAWGAMADDYTEGGCDE